MTNHAPIALFTFNRPDHTAATLQALAANELASESELTIFCDGPRTPDDEEKTRRVREIARSAQGFRHVRVVERDENLGLARSVITGVTAVLEQHESIIVLEDDLITSPFFLRFMNDSLKLYADDERVMSICGYTFPVERKMPDTFFLWGAFCWGWATWRRGWALYEHDPKRALEEIVRRDLIFDFDHKGSDPLTLALQATVIGDQRADSWATRWMATACLNGKLVLHPGESLVSNIGFDGSGRHANHDDRYTTPMATQAPKLGTVSVKTDPEVVKAHRDLFMRWRVASDPRKRLFFAITGLLPEALERRVYHALVHRWMKRGERTGRSVLRGGH